ncbi:MAG: hypothetical protein WD826_11105 [Actinomycetota bacterium]
MTADEIEGWLRRGLWLKLHRAVYRTAAAPLTFEGRALAAVLAAGPGAVVSHTAMARLFRVEGIADDTIHVTVPGDRCPRIPGVVVHQRTNLSSRDRTTIGPIPVTSMVRLMIDLASVVRSNILEDALDDLLRRGRVTVEAILRRLSDMDTRGVRGVRTLKRLLDVRLGKRVSLSGRQNKVRRILEAAGIKGIEREFEVRDERGAFVAFADLAIPSAKLAIEFDSYRWHSSPRHLARDRERRHRLTVAGWPPLEITEELVRRPDELISRVRSRLSRPYAG